MNKDSVILSFLCSRNEFDEPTFQELFWQVAYRPIGYKSLTGFLEHRKAPKHREHIQRLLERYGCDDLEGFLNVTHAVSLNDTFWVKKAKSNLTWDQMSLYRNEFDQLISEAAFDGSASSSELSTTSPVHRFRIKQNTEIAVMPVRIENQEIQNAHPSEIISAAKFLEVIKKNRDCTLALENACCLCKAMIFGGKQTALTDKLAPVEIQVVVHVNGTKNGCKLRCQKLRQGLNFKTAAAGFIKEDVLPFSDPALGIVAIGAKDPISMCPVFDNNRSLFPDLDQDQLEHPDWYLQRCKPMLGKNFLITARALMTPEIRSDLKNLLGFRFSQHDRITAHQERLVALNRIVNSQIKSIPE